MAAGTGQGPCDSNGGRGPQVEWRPLRRRLLNLLTALSLLLCTFSAALWVRSWLSFDSLLYAPAPDPPRKHLNDPGRPYTVEARGASASSHRGGLQLQWHVARVPVVPPVAPGGAPGPPPRKFRLLSQPLTRGNEAGFLAGAGAKGALGFYTVRRTVPSPLRPGQRADYEVRDVFVPYWSLVAATAALPLARGAGALRRRARRRSGACPGCGYDLRATPGRCPECGAPVSASTAA